MCGVGIPLVQRAPDFCEQLTVVLLPSKIDPFSPRCTHSFSGHREDGTNLFTHECFCERREPLCFNISPWTETWAGGGGYVCVILLFLSFWLFERIFFYLLSLKPNKKKRFFSTLLLIVISRHKWVIKKIQDFFFFWWKDNSRNVIWLHVYIYIFGCLVDSVSRGSVGKNQKEQSRYIWSSTLRFPHHIYPHTNFTFLVYDYTR